jgi:hypothetical protein
VASVASDALTHGAFDFECLGSCWVEAPGWIGVGSFIGGIANSRYDEHRRNKG